MFRLSGPTEFLLSQSLMALISCSCVIMNSLSLSFFISLSIFLLSLFVLNLAILTNWLLKELAIARFEDLGLPLKLIEEFGNVLVLLFDKLEIVF